MATVDLKTVALPHILSHISVPIKKNFIPGGL